MTILLLIVGILFILFGVLIIRKLPRISIKRAYLVILAGVCLLAAGLLLFFKLPEKGLLSEGEEGIVKSDDASGKPGEAAEVMESGTIIISGSDILIEGKTLKTTAELDDFLSRSDWKGGFVLVDKYASYDSYIKVKELLSLRGKEILSEEQRF